MTQKECVIVCTTLPTDVDAAVFGRGLVEKRLAACVSAWPEACSVYRWRDGVEQQDEQQIRIKTTVDRLAEVEAYINDTHPYEVPELLVVPVVSGSVTYLDWLRESTTALHQP